MKTYVTASIEILKLAQEDILTLSKGTGAASYDDNTFNVTSLWP